MTKKESIEMMDLINILSPLDCNDEIELLEDIYKKNKKYSSEKNDLGNYIYDCKNNHEVITNRKNYRGKGLCKKK